MMNKSIWQRKRELDKKLREHQEVVMADYNENVYYPAMRELIKECEKSGHVKGNFHDNGWGWCWFYCSQCGVPFDKKQYKISNLDDKDDTND